MIKRYKKNEILFYGPIGGKIGSVIGGGESGNRKTIALLEKLGFSIEVIEKPYPVKTKIIRALLYPFQLIFTYLKVTKTFIARETVSSFHLSGFYDHLIYIECLYIITAKILKINSVYELRAGGAVQSYNSGSKLYQWFFKKTIHSASKVLCQGEDYLALVEKMSTTPCYYYPNFIQDSVFRDIQVLLFEKNRELSIIYFGRIAPSKNIEFIIDVCSKISIKNFSCQIVGGGDISYILYLEKLIKKYCLQGKVSILGPHSSDKLFSLLSKAHFFIFPSNEPREGHSNALTEAMAHGVVPIASQAGFNRSVVKNDRYIVDELVSVDYAGRIEEFWYNDWSYHSQFCYEIAKNNYTEKSVSEVLTKVHSHD